MAKSTETSDGLLPERTKTLPPGLGKPPPLLPTPSGPHGRETPPGMREHSATPLMTSPVSDLYPIWAPRPSPLHCCPCTRVKGPPIVPQPSCPPFYTRPPRSVTSRTPTLPRPPRSPTFTEEPSYGTPACAVHLSRWSP
uniref:extensin-like n=1 Tax=Oncorhynchus gorbuscha TaxID=8017 RepID=UPI001EAE8C73|nr:extensin-like [Oncorhynchus gorbuscha]XP_046208400.1 extensin-like [Oncorhynchus gorbuscha]